MQLNLTLTRPKTIREALDHGTGILARSFDNPSVEAKSILGGLLNYSSALLHINGSEELSEPVIDLYLNLLQRRSRYEPVAYLLETKNFFGRDFRVDPRVLIPRPETELLVEEAIAAAQKIEGHAVTALDVGTGSGCMAVTLALSLMDKGCRVTATDLSPLALDLARTNARSLGALDRIHFVISNVYQGLSRDLKGHFDMIISNPPYIQTRVISTLDPDLSFEPRIALDGGVDGFMVIRPLVEQAPFFLKPGGSLMVEVGFDQGDRVVALFKQCGFRNIQLLKDFDGLDRIVTGELRGSI